MAQSFLISTKNSNSIAASATQYSPVVNGGATFSATTESNFQVIHETVGVLSLMYVRIITNDRGASTLKLRINAANGNQSISIGSSATGEFQDTTNSDSVAATNKLAFQIITGAGGTTFTMGSINIQFVATNNTSNRHGASIGSISTASTTFFFPISGTTAATETTEANAQFKMQVAGTFKNLMVNVITNARTTNTTFTSRKNTAAGAMTITVGNIATGFFEDTTNSDTIAAGDLVGFAVATGTGAQTLSGRTMCADFITTSNQFYTITAQTDGVTVNAAVTTYFNLGGALTADTTESDYQVKSQLTGKLSNMECYVSANTVTASSTLTLRKNATNGNQSIAIGSSTTGYFEDTSNTDTIIETDELNYQIVTGATGTSLTLRNIGVLVTPLPKLAWAQPISQPIDLFSPVTRVSI